VLVWGHRLVTVLSRDHVETLIRGGSVPTPVTATAPDWIFDGAISPRNTTSGVLVTAHNEVVPLEISQDDRPSLIFGALQSPSRPALYSAGVRWLPEEEEEEEGGCVLVAGGTVFGEIIVWKCHLPSSGAGRCEELFVFAGHEGSIFGVDISPEIEPAPGVKVRLLVSCSDDRTVRVWDITERPVGTSESLEPSCGASKTEVARETGFGNNPGEIMQGRHPSRAVTSVMGHTSRIWQVKFSRPDTAPAPGANIHVYSFGEDATTQRWRLSIDARGWWTEGAGADNYPSTLKHEETLKSHSGKHIWAAAVLPQEHDEPVIATGGADGGISLIGRPGRKVFRADAPLGLRNGVSQFLPRTRLLTVTVPEPSKQTVDGLEDEDGEDHALPAVEEASKKKSQKKDGDSFKVYAFISEDRLLAITVRGRLLLGSFDKDPLSWTEIALPEEMRRDLASYSVLKSPGLGIAFLGSASGSVYTYTNPSSVTKLADFPAKISDLFLLPGPGKAHGTPSDQTAGFFGVLGIKVLVTTLGQQQATILTVDSSTGQVLQGGGRSLPLEEGFIVTSTAVCGGFLVLGSRWGSIALHRELEDGNFIPLTNTRLEAQDAVTSLVPLPGQARRANPFFLAT
ncbi:MAG: hypothetical protein OK454_03460, partial [Thaumarchaeota archaeon]|nr:hypothetical protein [Nitrososphaerota archaeon]